MMSLMFLTVIHSMLKPLCQWFYSCWCIFKSTVDSVLQVTGLIPASSRPVTSFPDAWSTSGRARPSVCVTPAIWVWKAFPVRASVICNMTSAWMMANVMSCLARAPSAGGRFTRRHLLTRTHKQLQCGYLLQKEAFNLFNQTSSDYCLHYLCERGVFNSF